MSSDFKNSSKFKDFSNLKNIEDLYDKIKSRIESKDSSSYSFQLNQDGLEKINRKVGEEAIEVIIAAFNKQKTNNLQHRKDLVGEISDIIYHVLVLMINQDITFDELIEELNKRNKNG